LLDPDVQISLQRFDRAVDLLAKGNAVELVEHRAVEALANAIGLRALGLGAGVVDILNGQIELVLVALGVAAVLGAAVGEHPGDANALIVEERHDAVVEDFGGGDRGLAVVEFGKRDFGVGIDDCLLVDPPDTLERADIERVLGYAVPGAFAVELTACLIVLTGVFRFCQLSGQAVQ
jgi:hypothetical protein